MGDEQTKTLSDAARRARDEAEVRRRTKKDSVAQPETGGPTGPEPTRFGDWERKGIVSDF